jgi:hypothetical protein
MRAVWWALAALLLALVPVLLLVSAITLSTLWKVPLSSGEKAVSIAASLLGLALSAVSFAASRRVLRRARS